MRRRRQPAGRRDRRACGRRCSARRGASGWSSRGGAHRRGVGRAGAQAAASRGAALGPPARSTRFHAHVLFELLGLRELVMATPDDDVGRALRLCLSSMLVKFMKAGPEAPRDGADKRIARGVPSRMLADRAAELARGPGGAGAAHAARHARARGRPKATRARCPIARRQRGAGALVAALRRHLRLRRACTTRASSGWACRRRSSSACSSARGPSASATSRAARGATQQAPVHGEIARVLRPGGHALLVVGDGVVDGRAENAPDGIAAAGAAVGLEPVARASQARPLHDRRLAAIFGAQPAPRAPAAAREGSRWSRLEEADVVDRDVDDAAVLEARRGRELPLNAGQPDGRRRWRVAARRRERPVNGIIIVVVVGGIDERRLGRVGAGRPDPLGSNMASRCARCRSSSTGPSSRRRRRCR